MANDYELAHVLTITKDDLTDLERSALELFGDCYLEREPCSSLPEDHAFAGREAYEVKVYTRRQ